MPHNSRICGPILIILSLSHSQMNCTTAEKAWTKSATWPQICCRTTLQNLNVKLCNFTACYSMQMWCRIVYLQYLPIKGAKLCFAYSYRLICNSTTRVKIVSPRRTRMHATSQGCVSGALFNAANAALQNVVQVLSHNIPQTQLKLYYEMWQMHTKQCRVKWEWQCRKHNKKHINSDFERC